MDNEITLDFIIVPTEYYRHIKHEVKSIFTYYTTFSLLLFAFGDEVKVNSQMHYETWKYIDFFTVLFTAIGVNQYIIYLL